MCINAFIINRNLFKSLKKTIEFLSKKDEINIIVLDQSSTYKKCLEYYDETNYINVINLPNIGPYSPWKAEVKKLHNKKPFIVTDPDCCYDNVPDDWLDIMLWTLKESNYFKVGFSIEINDLPDGDKKNKVINWEKKYWEKYDKKFKGYKSLIDTTFCLYRSESYFAYNGLRLDRPYTIRHIPWYISEQDIDEEWEFYKKNCKFGQWMKS